MKFILKIFNFFLDILLPKKCINCGKTGEFICFECKLLIKEIDLSCPICKKLSLTGETHSQCKRKESLNGLISIFEYEGTIKKAIHLLKFKGLQSIASDLIFLAGEKIYENPYQYGLFAKFLFRPETIITFVPMRKKREKQRGYNQAKIIAERLAKLSKKETRPLLEKSQPTKPQTELNGKERIENIKNSFYFSGNYIPEKVVLIDDVVTTGSTLNECTKTLKKAGVREVWGFSLAKTRYKNIKYS